MKPFLAMIVPARGHGEHPDHELPGAQPKPPQPGAPDQTLPGNLPKPSHPIYYPLPPGAPVDPDYGVPIEHPDQGLPPTQPGTPTHPIATPPPGQPTHPIATPPPGAPTHPIALPPDAGGGWGPIYIWGGGPGARPPIAIPPEGETPPGKVEWKAAWTPTTGWVTFGIVVPGAETPVVTPSKK
jgi:hypothetical protein